MRFVRPRVPASLQLVALIALLSVLSFGTRVAVAAEFTVGASASGQTATKNVQQGGDTRTGSSPVWAGANVNVQDSAAGVLQNAEGVGYASASYGHLVFVSRAATSQTSVSGAQPGLHAESYASASMTDSFIISCATCVTGTRGTMNFRVVLEGDVGLSDPAPGPGGPPIDGPARTRSYYWSSNLSMRAEGVAMEFPGPGTLSLYAYDFRAMVEDQVVAGGSREGMGLYDYALDFEFGAPIHMNWQATAMSSADLRPEGHATGFLSAMGYAAFSNSFYWDGISAVTDADGNLVSGFTALNSVGVDYAQSFANAAVVPEPGTWALMVAGLVALGLLARRGHPRRSGAPSRIASMVAVVGGLLGLGQTAVAQEPPVPSFGVSYNYELEAPGTSGRSIQGGGATTPGEVRRFDDAIGFSGATLSSDARVEGWGAARYGHLQAFAKGSTSLATQAAERGTYTYGSVTSSLTDSFVIQCDTCAAGTIGTMYFHVAFGAATSRDGGLNQPPGGSGFYMADTNWTTSLNLSAAGVPDPPPLPPDGWGGPNLGQLWQTTYRLDKLHNGEHWIEDVTRGSLVDSEMWIQFVFGQPIRLDMSLMAGVLGGVFAGPDTPSFSGHGAMETDATRSMYWDGISNVIDAQGNVVSGFTALNAAGVDYARSFATAAAVPEPGTWALMAGGLLVVGLMARRRHAPRAAPQDRAVARLARCCGLLGLGVSALAQAQSFDANYGYTLGAPGATGKNEGAYALLSPGEATRFSDAIGYSDASLTSAARVEGWASASAGHLQAYAKGATSLTAQGPGQGTYMTGDINVNLMDDFVIQCGTCAAGTVGSLNFRLFFDGVTTRSGGLAQPATATGGYTATTDWSAAFAIDAEGVPGPLDPGRLEFQFYRTESLHNGVGTIEESPGLSAGLQLLSIRFVFGQPIHLAMGLSATLNGGVNTGGNTTPFSGYGAMETDATRSMYWDGITGVFDAQGNMVNGFTALNATGIDYARSFATAAVVPEPGTWVLLAAGLALLGWRLRRPGRSALTQVLSAGAFASTPMLAQAQSPEFLTSQTLTTSLAGEQLTQTRDGSLRNVRVDGALTQMAQTADLAGSVQLSTWGRAGYGYAQAFAHGASHLATTRPDQAAEAWGTSSAISRDRFVIACAGCVAGTLGYFSARVYVDGVTHLAGGVDSPDALHAGYVDRGAGVSIEAEGVPWDTPPPDWPHGEPFPPNNPGHVFEGGQRMDILYNDYTETFGDASFGPGYRHMTVFFIFGQPIHLQLQSSAGVMAVVSARGQPSVDGWAMSTTDFSRSTFWDGLDGVVDSSGAPLREFTALNAAGIDYRYSFAAAAAAAVPEPATWALMAAAIAALTLRVRVRRGAGRQNAGPGTACRTRSAAPGRPVSRLLLALAVPALAWPTMASGTAETFASTSNRVISQLGEEWDADSRWPVDGPAFSSSSVIDIGAAHTASGFSRTWALARPGEYELSLSGAAFTAANGEGAWIYSEGGSSAFRRDRFVVTCPTCVDGTRGSLTIQLQVGATMNWRGGALPNSVSPNYGGIANWSSALRMHVDGIEDAQGQTIYSQLYTGTDYEFANGVLTTTTGGNHAPGRQSLTLDFIFGRPVDFVWSASLSFILGAGHYEPHDATSWASIDMSVGRNDMYWGGITSVLDGNGQRIAGYRALNDEGIDFAQSMAVVPEPGTWLLMAAGLAAVSGLARRRHAARRGRSCGIAATAVALTTLMGTAGTGAQAADFSIGGYSYSRSAVGEQEDRLDFRGSPGPIRQSFASETLDQAAGHTSITQGKASGLFSYGSAHLSAQTTAFLDSRDGAGSAYSAAMVGGQWSDRFFLACAGCETGAAGFMTFRIVVDGVRWPDGYASVTQGSGAVYDAQTHWQTSLVVNAPGVPVDPGATPFRFEAYESAAFHNGDRTRDGSPVGAGTYTFTVPVTLNQAVDLSWASSLYATATVGLLDTDTRMTGWASSVTDFSNSFHWDGILAVTDAQGQALPGYSAFNDRGIDYAASLAVPPVPEPGTWALMVAGLALLLLGRSRRRSP